MTPLEVSRSVADRGVPARFVSLLGASGAGKTVFLGVLLDMLTKGWRGLRGLPNGPFSVSVQQETITALENRRFPEKTPSEADNWRWVHCEVSSSRRQKDFIDVITPDFAGEAIAVEIEQPGTFPTIQHIVRRSQGLLLLIDSLKARDAGRDEDFFSLKLTSYVQTLHGGGSRKRRRKLPVPLAIILTKSDSCPEALHSPREFVSANLPGLANFCRQSVARHRFFASGVVGSTAILANDFGHRLRIPLHVEPRGVIEPLEWIMQNL